MHEELTKMRTEQRAGGGASGSGLSPEERAGATAALAAATAKAAPVQQKQEVPPEAPDLAPHQFPAPSSDDVAGNFMELYSHLQKLDYTIGDTLTKQLATTNIDVLTRALEIQETFAWNVGHGQDRGERLEANWPRALRRAFREELEQRGRRNYPRRPVPTRAAAAGRPMDMRSIQRGGCFPDIDPATIRTASTAWWREVAHPIFGQEKNWEFLILPEHQQDRFDAVGDLSATYGFDSVLLKNLLQLTSKQLDVFLNEYAPDSRDMPDDRAFNMKAMVLIRKTIAKVDKEEGELL